LIAHATINSIRVLRFRCGGLNVALQTARLLGRLRPTQVVTYRAREQEHPWLEGRRRPALPSGW